MQSDPTQTTVPCPSKEVFEFLCWACTAAVNEFYISTDDHTNYDAASKWLDQVGTLFVPFEST